MYKHTAVMLVGAVAALAATSARAGFIEVNVEQDPPRQGQGLAVNVGIEEDGSATVDIAEMFLPGQDSLGLAFSGVTDEDPVMTITKVVENTTGFDWIGYQIDLDVAGAPTFTGTPVSNEFTYDAGASTNKSLVFAPGTLPSGESVTFAFDILVPDAGPFGFTLTQTPRIPEPATLLMGLLMAGAGGAVALRYRWG